MNLLILLGVIVTLFPTAQASWGNIANHIFAYYFITIYYSFWIIKHIFRQRYEPEFENESTLGHYFAKLLYWIRRVLRIKYKQYGGISFQYTSNPFSRG